ncbi:MAG: flagellar biosynthetic protein FliR [Acidobacteriota bacterium]
MESNLDFFFNIITLLLKSLGIEENPERFFQIIILIMGRLVAAINFTPFFGGNTVSSRIKIALAISLSFLLYPAVAATVPPELLPRGFLPLVLLLLKEAMVGFTLGFITSLIFHGIQSAGQMVDNMRGATIAQLLSLEFNTQVSLVGQIKLQAAIVLFFILNGHLLFIRGLFYSFEVLPINAFPRTGGGIAMGNELTPLVSDLIRLSSDVLIVSMQLAAPVLVCLFLTDIVFGIFNRVAPQINVFFLSLSVKMLVACAMLFLLWGAIVSQMEERFSVYLKALYTFIAKGIPGG